MDPEADLNADAGNSSNSVQEAVKRLTEQARACLYEARLDEGIRLCEEGLRLAAPQGLEKPEDVPGAAECLLTLGRMHMGKSDYGLALACYQQSLELYKRCQMPREVSLCLSYVGVTFTSLGEYPRAVETLQKAVHEAQAIGDIPLEAEILNDLAYTYVLTGEADLALPHLERSIAIFRETGDAMRLSWAVDSLGQAYLLLGRSREALDCILEGFQLAKNAQVWRDVVRYLQSAGRAYLQTGDIPQAFESFNEQLRLARESGFRGDECDALLSLADLKLTEGNPTDALLLLQDALRIAAEIGVKNQEKQSRRLLAAAYKQLGDYPKALDEFERYHEATQAIFNSEADRRLKNLQVLHQLETAKKEAEIYQLRAQALQIEIEERKKNQTRLEQLARTDPLTDVLNRRGFFETAERIFAETIQDARLLSLILIDLDRFKLVNDSYGHQIGDQALALVAERLRSHIRSADHLGRYGGEEFIVLLPGVARDQALYTAERLRLAVCSQPIHLGALEIPITLSLGTATLDPEALVDSLDQLIGQADKALYRAKDAGRNAALPYS